MVTEGLDPVLRICLRGESDLAPQDASAPGNNMSANGDNDNQTHAIYRPSRADMGKPRASCRDVRVSARVQALTRQTRVSIAVL